MTTDTFIFILVTLLPLGITDLGSDVSRVRQDGRGWGGSSVDKAAEREVEAQGQLRPRKER